MNEIEGSNWGGDEGQTAPEPQAQELANNAATAAGDARSSAKIENMIRDDKFYEIPAEFPYLMHATRIDNIEAIMWTGLEPFKGQADEERTLDYVDPNVVCAVAPKKIKALRDQEAIATFPASARTVGRQVRLTFEMPPGEKVMIWDVSSSHPRECRIDHAIQPEQIHSIQDMSGNTPEEWGNSDGSLWGFFAQNAQLIPVSLGMNGRVEDKINLANKFPDVYAGAGLNQLVPFLAQYELPEDLEVTATALANELKQLCYVQSRVLFDLRDRWKQQPTESDLRHLSRVFDEYLKENSEPHERAVAITDELKAIFTETIQGRLGIDPVDVDSFNAYLDYVRERYDLSKDVYRVRTTGAGYEKDSPWYGNSFEVNENSR